MAMEVVVGSHGLCEDEKALAATPEDLEALADQVRVLKRVARWGFLGCVSGIVALMICLCDSVLKTRMDKLVEYATLSILLTFFLVCVFVAAITLFRPAASKDKTDICAIFRKR